jgi:hypothetical protein
MGMGDGKIHVAFDKITLSEADIFIRIIDFTAILADLGVHTNHTVKQVLSPKLTIVIV